MVIITMRSQIGESIVIILNKKKHSKRNTESVPV